MKDKKFEITATITVSMTVMAENEEYAGDIIDTELYANIDNINVTIDSEEINITNVIEDES